MIIILRTTTYKHPPKKLTKYVPKLLSSYWKVFNTNNSITLKNFFNEPLIRFLWSKYPKEEIGEYFSKLNEKEMELIRKDIKDMKLEAVIHI